MTDDPRPEHSTKEEALCVPTIRSPRTTMMGTDESAGELHPISMNRILSACYALEGERMPRPHVCAMLVLLSV